MKSDDCVRLRGLIVHQHIHFLDGVSGEQIVLGANFFCATSMVGSTAQEM